MRRTRRQRHAWRSFTALVAGIAAFLALAVGSAAAFPATQVWTGDPGGSTEDIEIGGLTFFDTAGDPIPSGGLAGTINFTIDGTPYVGYCIDTTRIFSTAPEPVEVTVEQPPDSQVNRALAWILLNRTPTGPPTDEKAFAAATAQVATWLLVDEQIRTSAPTSDDALNAAAAALVDEALAATASPASLGLTVASPAVGATTTTVTVTGRPGALVDLTATGGTLSAAQVTLDATGSATLTLTAPSPGTATVTATTAGDGRLLLIEPTDQERQGQPTAAAVPTELTETAQVAFQAAPTPPSPGTGGQPTPVVPPTVPVAQRPSLAIVKRAPARAQVLRPVRFTITVRNTSRVVARNVVLRDRIPGGLSFVRASRRPVVRRGVLTFRIGTLRPGQRRTVNVWLRASSNVRGRRVNVATVSATRARPKRARAAVTFRAPLRRIQPAVTG